jgi:RNA polymerase sigma-70 factor (ECF subfamily)
MRIRGALRQETPESLLAAWRDRSDPRALAALFDRTAPHLFRVALSVAPDAATAEEAVQETFLVLLRDPGACDPSRPVTPWLVGVLRHKVLDARRRERRVPDPLRLEPRILPEDPADAAARRDAVDRVRAALDALPEPYRTVALLRWEYGLEPGEIAHARGLPPGTVRSLLSRSLDRLRKAVGGGAALALVLGVRPPTGLAGLRRSLLERAGGAGSGTAAAAGLAVGGVLVTKSAVAAGLAAALLLGAILGGGAVAIGLRPSPEAPPRDSSTAVDVSPLAEPPSAAARGPGPRPPAPDAPPAPAATAPGPDAAAAEVRKAHALLDGLDGTWFTAYKVGGTLAKSVHGPAVLAVVRERWPGLPRVVDRCNLMKGYAFSLAEDRFEVIDLGVRDPDPEVRRWAFDYLLPYAERGFHGNLPAYEAWRESVRGRRPEDLLRESADRLLGLLRAALPADRGALLERLEDVAWRLDPDSPPRAAIADALAPWLADPAWPIDPLLEVAEAAKPGPVRARELIEGLLRRGGEPERRALLLAGRIRAAWAAPALAERLLAADAGLAAAAAGALADLEDARAVGPLSEALAARGPDEGARAVASALAALSGVTEGEARDAAWWREWWAENRERIEREAARKEEGR